ncbi:5-dehydro-4-deoxyglucarate dehydratase [Lacisediminihabitans profunda]|uniref:Probable 5-dehydro-4-deoxyglucarate dehydratase n=1 Tax=Lacisediminihabitans profunda TaxID=2594790 RepID=A0A5C8UQP0_9MICO|nr:5-dehydro-4-deoxyglucarate dehydratase [Lacisediminihabitans profunda]TXN30911.1 5-dehydro-4-deoxyglucarate dehydratase [Lacisediminihabitans profunda]
MSELVFPQRVLYFPVTPFDERGAVAPDALDEHLASRLVHNPGAVFIACGTGEFHALSLAEYELVVGRGVAVTSGTVPVVAGTGGPLGHAIECAIAAEKLGANALLVMPPYLVTGPQAGTVAYVETIAAATDLPLIVYHRGASQLSISSFEVLAANPRVAGFKDGVGDIALAQEFVLAAGRSGRSDLQFFNGLLTAELSQRAYRAVGVPLYSSAVFAMAPEIANAWFRAYIAHDDARLDELLEGFFVPLVRLRDTTPGYAVALIKAGLELAGARVGGVRPPLVAPSAEHRERLARVLERGRELVG